MEIVQGKGILEQINGIPQDNSPATLKDFEDMVEIIQRKSQEPIMYPAGLIMSLPDKYFESMVRSNITILGGLEMAEKIKERMKKLNIEL